MSSPPASRQALIHAAESHLLDQRHHLGEAAREHLNTNRRSDSCSAIQDRKVAAE